MHEDEDNVLRNVLEKIRMSWRSINKTGLSLVEETSQVNKYLSSAVKAVYFEQFLHCAQLLFLPAHVVFVDVLLQELKKYGVTTVVRVCEATYDATLVVKEGIQVLVSSNL